MRAALSGLSRYIVTAEVAKHRTFVWVPMHVLPDKRLIVIARDDDTTLGILSSHIHELWSLNLGATLEDRPCYRPTTCFKTFPFPVGANCIRPPLMVAENGNNSDDADKGACHAPLQKPCFAAIATASRRLVELRDNWLNPPNASEADLKKRTLTNLYNARPAWLDNAHKALDKAVAAAYCWPDDLTDDEILSHLLALNLERASAERR
jgi:hypothetical protein